MEDSIGKESYGRTNGINGISVGPTDEGFASVSGTSVGKDYLFIYGVNNVCGCACSRKGRAAFTPNRVECGITRNDDLCACGIRGIE